MNKVFLVLALMGSVIVGQAYASDWDEFGKVMAVVGGVRVVDALIGNDHGPEVVVIKSDSPHRGRDYRRDSRYDDRQMVWVPNYVKVREYVPAHYEFEHNRRIYVRGHFVTRIVERGGRWEKVITPHHR